MSSRFTHYCLDDGDEYFGDVIAEYRTVRVVLATNEIGSSSSATALSPSSSQANSPLSSSAAAPILQYSGRRFVEIYRASNITSNCGSSGGSSSNNNSVLAVDQLQSTLRGRMRFAGKGVFFDSDETAVPIVGFKATTLLSSWDQLRGATAASSETWSASPVVALAGCAGWLGADVIAKMASPTASTSSPTQQQQQQQQDRVARAIVFPFSGTTYGQRRFGLPHPHIVDSGSFHSPCTSTTSSASSATTTNNNNYYYFFLHCFIFPYVSSNQEFLNRLNMLLLAGVQRAGSISSNNNAMSPASPDGNCTSRVTAKLRMIQIARESQAKFKIAFLQDPDTEELLREVCCHRIQPLVRERGRAVISSTHIYFQPTFPVAQSSGSSDDASAILCVDLRCVVQVERRWFACSETALEIFFETVTAASNQSSSSSSSSSSIFLHFENLEQRELFGSALRKHSIVRPILRAASVHHVQEMWHQGRVSNLDYLLYLNSFAGRSRQDLSQYPVLPWVIAKYTASSKQTADGASSFPFDFADSSNYRDLSKPVGALNQARLDMFRARAAEMKEIGEPSFLYATHYSNPAYVVYFLLRSMPQLMLVLQSGRWDKPTRLFESLPEVWKSVLNAPTDVKELIPEFFEGNGDFLDLRQSLLLKSASGSNGNGSSSSTHLGLDDDSELESLFDFGKKDDGVPVRFAVDLPPWAEGSAKKFVEVNRAALESAIVSENLHLWIDLIFGSKQRGEEAWRADNVFHPMCYEHYNNSNDKSSIGGSDDGDDDVAARMAHQQLFGMVPRQIFTEPHPQRRCCRQSGQQHESTSTSTESSGIADKKCISLREALLEISKSADFTSPMTSPLSGAAAAAQQHHHHHRHQNNAAATNSSFGSSQANESLQSSFDARAKTQDMMTRALDEAGAALGAIPTVESVAPEFFQGFDSPPRAGFDGKTKQAESDALVSHQHQQQQQQRKNHGNFYDDEGDDHSGKNNRGDSHHADPSATGNDGTADHPNKDDDAHGAASLEMCRGTGDIMIQCLARGAGMLPEKSRGQNVSCIVVTGSGCIVALSRDGTEASALSIGPRGVSDVASAATVTLPERCVAMLPWEGEWVVLVSSKGTVLVLSAEKCRVYSRVPDTANDSVITACGVWADSRRLFCGHEDGNFSVWSIVSSNSNNGDSPSSSSSSSSAPPVLSKTDSVKFESGQPLYVAARDNVVASLGDSKKPAPNARIVLVSDDGETLLASTLADKTATVKEFAGFPHDVDIKSVALVWPVNLARATCTSSGSAALADEVAQLRYPVVAVGALQTDGKIFTLVADAEGEAGEMFDVADTAAISAGMNNSSCSMKITTSCILSIPPSKHAGTASAASGASSSSFLLAAVGNGVAILDADTCKVVTFLETTFSSGITHIAAAWPFAIAVDSSSGAIMAWEMLMF